MPFDFNAWLDSLDLAPELKEAMKKVGEDEKARAKLAEQVLMRSDYSRSMDQLKADQKAVEDGKAALADLEKTYRESGSKTQAERDAFKAEASTLRKQLFDAQEKIRTEYNTYGNAEETIKDLGLDKVPEVKVEQKQEQPAVDMSKYVSVDVLDGLRNAALIWPAKLQGYQIEHSRLFTKKEDKPFDPVEFTRTVAEKQQDPDLVYDELYGATARRKELERASIEAELRTKLEAEYQSKIDAMTIDPMRIQQNEVADDPFSAAINSLRPEAGKDLGPLTPTGVPGQAGIEQAREVRKAQLGQPAG